MRIRETIIPPAVGEASFARGETIREGRLIETWLTVPHPTEIGLPLGILRLEASEERFPPHLVDQLKGYALWLYEQEQQRAEHVPPHPPRPRLVP